MTRRYRGDDEEKPWKAWLRGNRSLDSIQEGLTVTDSDMWVHKYGHRKTRYIGLDRDVQYLMLVEVKANGEGLPGSQRDTLIIVNDLLRTVIWQKHRDAAGRLADGHPQNARTVWSWWNKRKVQVHCYGVHVLWFDGPTPVDSDVIKWDSRRITVEQLEQLFRYELHPDSLRELEHRHHKKLIVPPMALFDLEA